MTHLEQAYQELKIIRDTLKDLETSVVIALDHLANVAQDQDETEPDR